MIGKILLHIGKNLSKARCRLISMVCSRCSWMVSRDSTTPCKFCTFYLTFVLLKNFNFIMKWIALFPRSTTCLNDYLYNLKKYEIKIKKKKKFPSSLLNWEKFCSSLGLHSKDLTFYFYFVNWENLIGSARLTF